MIKLAAQTHLNSNLWREMREGEDGNGDDDYKSMGKRNNNRNANIENPEPAKRFSNHIEFKDYIPTHETITYRHLFGYGFYVE